MGRSQLQFRRGRGREGRGRGSSRPIRDLGSNAFRFTDEDAEEESSDGDEKYDLQDEKLTKKDLRYNPSIQTLSESISTGGGGHFQTKTMKEWDQDELKQSVPLTLNFQAIGTTLNAISPEEKYMIDPRFCIDIISIDAKHLSPVSPPAKAISEIQAPKSTVVAPTIIAKQVAPTQAAPSFQSTPASVVSSHSGESKPTPMISSNTSQGQNYDDELDELLNM